MSRAAVAFAGYLLAVVVLTWPLAPMSSTHLPHTGGWFVSDLYYAGWALSWQTHALMTDPAHFADGNIYGGTPLALFYGTPGFGLLPMFAPIFAATGNTTLALDVAFLLSLAWTATMIHLVVVAWTDSRPAGIAAASTYLTSRGVIGLCAAAPQYAALAAIPLIAWLLARDGLGRRETIALAALVAVQALTDVIYIAVPVVTTLGVLALARLAHARSRPDGRRIVMALVVAGCALLPIYAATRRSGWRIPISPSRRCGRLHRSSGSTLRRSCPPGAHRCRWMRSRSCRRLPACSR